MNASQYAKLRRIQNKLAKAYRHGSEFTTPDRAKLDKVRHAMRSMRAHYYGNAS